MFKHQQQGRKYAKDYQEPQFSQCLIILCEYF